MEECFHLSASPFCLTYTDDDGETFDIRSEADLTEAIAYFVSGDDDQAQSTYSGTTGVPPPRPMPFSSKRVSLKLEVVLEYDGPSLSDTSSISSFRTGTERDGDGDGASQGSWSESGYGSSYRSYGSGLEDAIPEEDGVTEYAPPGRDQSRSDAQRDSLINGFDGLGLETVAGGPQPAQTYHRGPLTGPDSDPAPSLLTHSDLGSRWLREQSRLPRRAAGPASRRSAARSRRYESDEESLGSDDENLGDIALVRDARGRYYYSYENSDGASLASGGDHAGPSRTPPSRQAGTPRPALIPPIRPIHEDITPQQQLPSTEPSAAPILAPDCSACGVRLDYMRYVCQTCGEGPLWHQDAPDRPAHVPPRVLSDSDVSDAATEMAWKAQRSASMDSGVSPTVINGFRPRTGSTSTNMSAGSLQVAAGPTPPDSPILGSVQLPNGEGSIEGRGYELCPGCIEVHGIAHSKAAAKEVINGTDGGDRGSRRARRKRHAFREKIWGPEGWVDVGEFAVLIQG